MTDEPIPQPRYTADEIVDSIRDKGGDVDMDTFSAVAVQSAAQAVRTLQAEYDKGLKHFNGLSGWDAEKREPLRLKLIELRDSIRAAQHNEARAIELHGRRR